MSKLKNKKKSSTDLMEPEDVTRKTLEQLQIVGIKSQSKGVVTMNNGDKWYFWPSTEIYHMTPEKRK